MSGKTRTALITPMPWSPAELRRAGTVVVFGGTFDPPHRWHVRGPRVAMERAGLGGALLLYVPAARSPHKAQGPLASDEDRVAMLRLALGGRLGRGSGRGPGRGANATAVWTDELDRARAAERGGRASGSATASAPQPSYMIDTVERLRRLVGRDVNVRLLIGADQAAQFHRWRRARALFRAARPLVMPRGEIRDRSSLRGALEAAGFWTARELDAWEAGFVDVGLAPAASSIARGLIAGAPADAAAWKRREGLDQIPAAVARYIVRRGLYGREGAGSKGSGAGRGRSTTRRGRGR
ncbi:MAG TPA: hypothetical protein PL072_11930 [Phycisphaerales bacterium]|nr:hypothetical protein [Phycisphaerales bacterium]